MQDSVIQESVPLARDGDTIAEVRSLSSENWEKELDSGRKLLLIGNSSCQACVEWKNELVEWTPPDGLAILEIQLDQPGLGRFKIEHPWIASIQILPFNAIFSDGEIVEQWAGSGTSRLEEKLLSIMS